MPILAFARTRPIVRISEPPMSFICTPKTYPTGSAASIWSGCWPCLFAQRLTALALAADPALHPPGARFCLNLLGTIGRIGPNAKAGVAPQQKLIHRLAIMQRRIPDMVSLAHRYKHFYFRDRESRSTKMLSNTTRTRAAVENGSPAFRVLSLSSGGSIYSRRQINSTFGK